MLDPNIFTGSMIVAIIAGIGGFIVGAVRGHLNHKETWNRASKATLNACKKRAERYGHLYPYDFKFINVPEEKKEVNNG